jgi:uncharacterized protein with HEPN domain
MALHSPIREAGRAGEYLAEVEKKQFLADGRTFDATQLCLLRIGEAAKKLGSLARELAPDQLCRIGIGNPLRLEYDQIDRYEIWRTVKDDLAPLRAACVTVIQMLRKGPKASSVKARKKPNRYIRRSLPTRRWA